MRKENVWLNGEGWWGVNAFAWAPEMDSTVRYPEPWGRYAYSFKEAADRLTESILQGKPGAIDLLLMPILHLYRHWIELSIKCSIRDLKQHLGEHAKIKSGHSLTPWFEMIELAKKLSGIAESAHNEASKFVEEIMELDPTGQTFRYPESLEGLPTWAGPKWINIERLAEGITHVEQTIWWVEGVLNNADESLSLNTY